MAGLLVTRIRREGAVQTARLFIRSSQATQRDGFVFQRQRMSRVELNRPVQTGHAFGIPLQGSKRRAFLKPRVGIPRIDLERTSKKGKTFFVTSDLIECQTESAQGVGILRTQIDSTAQSRGCLFVTLQVEQAGSLFLPRAGHVRLKRNHPVKTRDRVLEPAQFSQRNPFIERGNEMVGLGIQDKVKG